MSQENVGNAATGGWTVTDDVTDPGHVIDPGRIHHKWDNSLEPALVIEPSRVPRYPEGRGALASLPGGGTFRCHGRSASGNSCSEDRHRCPSAGERAT
jgi:hypothetical protein